MGEWIATPASQVKRTRTVLRGISSMNQFVDVDAVARMESFRALKLTLFESFRKMTFFSDKMNSR